MASFLICFIGSFLGDYKYGGGENSALAQDSGKMEQVKNKQLTLEFLKGLNRDVFKIIFGHLKDVRNFAAVSKDFHCEFDQQEYWQDILVNSRVQIPQNQEIINYKTMVLDKLVYPSFARKNGSKWRVVRNVKSDIQTAEKSCDEIGYRIPSTFELGNLRGEMFSGEGRIFDPNHFEGIPLLYTIGTLEVIGLFYNSTDYYLLNLADGKTQKLTSKEFPDNLTILCLPKRNFNSKRQNSESSFLFWNF